MVRHNVVAFTNDHPGDVRQVSFAATRGSTTSPSACLTSICIQQRLPAGRRPVLINQTHTDTDLFVPIDAAEKRLFDAIDGQSTVANSCGARAIIGGRRRARDRARLLRAALVVRPVVFDASRVLPPRVGGGVRAQAGVTR
jgi:hypothetical protein